MAHILLYNYNGDYIYSYFTIMMKYKTKKELFFRIALIALLVLLISIPVCMLLHQPINSLQNIIDRILNDEETGISIVGIGIYLSTGTAKTRWGSAPEQLSETEISSEHVINFHTKTLKYIQPTKLLDSAKSSGYIYIEYDVREALSKFRAIQVSAIIAFTSILILFITLYKKNADYRKKMASNEQLVRLGEIARTLSHEIKNPLGAIRMQTGYLKRVLHKEDDNKIKIEKLSIIEEEVQRLVLLTNRIGDFLRDPIGTPVTIELSAFIKEMIKRFDYNISFDNKTEKGVTILADQDRLRSVIENLLKNAIESMRNNNRKTPVEITLNSDGKKIELSIMDRGCGIPQDLAEKVFDPFFTSKTKGSGIGLFVSGRFIEAMGGSLLLLPRKGGGTEARIVLKKDKEK